MSRLSGNPLPQLREIATAQISDLSIEQITRLDLADTKELSYVAQLAMQQEPPNKEIASLVAGMCVSRISRVDFVSVGEKNILMSAACNALPALENAEWISSPVAA